MRKGKRFYVRRTRSEREAALQKKTTAFPPPQRLPRGKWYPVFGVKHEKRSERDEQKSTDMGS